VQQGQSDAAEDLDKLEAAVGGSKPSVIAQKQLMF